MKKRIKKLAKGTGPIGHIPSPNDALVENQLMIDKAQAKSDANVWTNTVIPLAGSMLSSGIGGGSFTKKNPTAEAVDVEGMSEGIVQTPTELPEADMESLKKLLGALRTVNAFGNDNAQGDIEVEGGEIIETPDGQVEEVEGPSHGDGGVQMNVPEQTLVFSDRVKGDDGKTMAQRKKIRERNISKLNSLLEGDISDVALKNTYARRKEILEKEEESDLKIQEMINLYDETSSAIKQFAKGTGLNGVIPENLTTGDFATLYGTFKGMTDPLKNVEENRASDTPNINPYLNFGKESLKTLEGQKDFVGVQEAEALRTLNRSNNSTKKRMRGSARGVNAMRAMDLVSDVANNAAAASIHAGTVGQMADVNSQIAQTQSSIDQAVMGGEAAKDLANRQDKDNYYSQRGEALNANAEGIQMIGKNLNKAFENDAQKKLVNQLSNYFEFDENNNIIGTSKAGSKIRNVKRGKTKTITDKD